LIALIAGREILTLLYRAEYAEYADLLVWMMVVAGIGYVSTFLGWGMTTVRYLRVQMPLFVLVASTSAIACYWLIPAQGLRGAAIALVVAAVVRTTFSLGVIFHALHRLSKYAEAKQEPYAG
jgi:O-antigen/teichoic acid export membrane protein